MKKAFIFLIAIFLLCNLVSCSGTATNQEIISNELGIDIASGNIETYTDTHGGFHGDGETYSKITFSDDSFYNEIKNNTDWSPFPLTPNLTVVVYGGTDPNGDSWESFIKDKNDNTLIPEITNGYYFFIDRHSDFKNNKKDDSKIFDRHSMNFTLAIYDITSKTLYFYAIDT